MNARKISLVLMILTLLAMSFGLASMGCKGGKGTDEKAADESDSKDITFFERGGDSGEPGGWRAISENVVGQIETTYEEYGMKVESLDRSETGSTAVRAVLSRRDGLSSEKELLDGLRMLYDTFPNQSTYVVKISREGDPEVEANVAALTKVVEAGYSLDTPAGEEMNFWGMLSEPADETEETSGSNASVSSDSGR